MMKAKRNTALKAGRRANSSVADLKEQIERQARELDEARERETAAAEVLRVISSFPGDLKPVFEAIISNAQRICGARFGNLVLFDGKNMRVVAMHNAAPEHMAMRQRDPIVPLEKSILGPLVRTKMLVHVADITAEEPYASSALARVGGMRTALAVPMLRDDELVGAIGIYNNEVRPFTDKQIALLTNFAAQAVIAVENTRLLNELRESLEQQTATSEVLQAISSSPGELEPVFRAMLANATRICDAQFGNLLLFDGKNMRVVALHNAAPKLVAMRQRDPIVELEKSILGPLVRTKRLVHVTDISAEESYASSVLAKVGGMRTALAVPMLRDDELVGAIGIYNNEVRPFTEKQIELLTNFASQAVIAVENTRLLSELRESLQQQTATADVLKVISSSPGELEPVFNAMLENATRICEAKLGNLFLREGNCLRAVAVHGDSYYADHYRREPMVDISQNPGTPLDRVIKRKQVIHISDLRLDQSYLDGNRFIVALADTAGARTELVVPMLKEDELVGAIVIYRQMVRPFADKQIALVQNFAAQAVIAIENTRLLNELRQRTADLSKSLHNLRTAQDRLVQTQKLASLGQLTAGIAHEIKNPLNFVNNFSGLSVELLDELQEAVESGTFDGSRRAEIAELTDALRGNLDKIAQHGKRADSIVKNMLLHSREGSGERRPVNVNALVEESLNLAYHGARAEKQGFSITLERSFDPEAGEADVFPQEITRVLLNLIANGFYAATTRQGEADDSGYEPILTASTRSLGDSVQITIRDNGTGVPPEVKEKMFNPFFTTKPAGEGTGLGLSISHDIIVKQHAGAIEVDTMPGEFTEFRIILPRTAA